jgi:hypothetical protein
LTDQLRRFNMHMKIDETEREQLMNSLKRAVVAIIPGKPAGAW